MIFNWKSKRFNDLVLMFNNKFLSISKYSSNNILPLQSSSNEVGESIDVDSSVGINLSDERDFSFGNRQREIPFRVDICVKAKTIRQMFERFPYLIFEYAWKPCAVFFLSKPSMGLPIMQILKKPFTVSSEGTNSWAIMSLEYPVLPECVEAFDRGVSSRLSLRNKDQMNAKKQVQSYKLRDTELIPSSARSRHLIVHLGDPRNTQKSPRFNKMQAERQGLFIGGLAGKSCMPSHIDCMERVETSNSVRSSEMSWTHKICLLQIAHLLSLNVWIRLIAAISFWLFFLRLAVTTEDSGYSGNGRDVFNPSSFDFPVNDFWPDSGECRSSGIMRFKFFPDRENSINHTLISVVVNSLWSTAFVPETIKALFPVSCKPLGKPEVASLYGFEYLIKSYSINIKLYSLVANIILIIISHRLLLLQNCFGVSLIRDDKLSML